MLGGAWLATGCSAPPIRYQSVSPPTVRLPTAELPKLLLEDVDDHAGQGDLRGPSPPNVRVEWATLVRDALVEELGRLGWPLTESRKTAGARLRVSVENAQASWGAGFAVRVDGKIRIGLALTDARGVRVWESKLIGAGVGKAGGGGIAGNGVRQAWNAALNNALPKLGPLLDSDRPWELIGKTPASVALPARVEAPLAPAAVRSDIDELPGRRAAVRPKAYAVVIGVGKYRRGLPAADFAAEDARLVAGYLRSALGYPDANVATLINDEASKGDFEKYFERWLPNHAEEGSEVFVYYSGHGAPNPKTADAYLVPYDADPTYLAETGYPLKKMYEQLAKLPTSKVTVVMDSCFSGAGGRSVIAAGARPLVTMAQAEIPGTLTVIAASASDQISNTYQDKGHGLFTYYFLKGIKEKGEDMRAVFDYLKPQVSGYARRELNTDQDPQWRGR